MADEWMKTSSETAAGSLQRAVLTAALVALVLAGCVPVAPPPREPVPERPAPQPLTVPPVSYFQGMLPCDDCAGVLTELTLRSDPATGGPGEYTLRETLLATRDGDRGQVRTGRWNAVREGDGLRYVLLDRNGQPDRQFGPGSDGTLRLLDEQGRMLPPQLPQTLQPATELPVALILADAGRVTEVPVGNRLVLRLALRTGTGYVWTLTGGGGGALVQEGEPSTVPAPASVATTGAGGWQVYRFRAARPGRQTLRFEYRRPWEQRPPAQVAEFTIEAVSGR